MRDHHIPAKVTFFGASITSVILVVLVLPTVAFALTPIARWDVVPYQRIESGETFNAGVIAFSKAGINRVEITVSGQGYSGPNPLVSRSMTYNERTDVYEYWVPLKGSNFSTNGAFTMQAVVYGADGGRRTLETLPFMVNATGALPQPKAWVSKTGSDATGAINNSSRPFLTLKAAVSAIQSANGGKSDGAIIYLFAGTYNLGDGTVSTTNEWLTITRDPGVTRENTIINASGTVRNTKLLKIEGVSLKSQGSGLYIFATDTPLNLWVNDSNILGSGRWVLNSSPVHHTNGYYYNTNSYVFDVDYGFRKAGLVRGVVIEKVGDDAFSNTPLVINASLDDLDNGTTGVHSDVYQVHTTGFPPADNRIIYNYKATNVHYEGIFMRSDAGVATNNAFVNVFVELREPASPNESDLYAFMSFAVYHSWDHLLVWHCSFLVGHSEIYATLTNSSFVGNVFYQYVDTRSAIGISSLPYAVNGNTGQNDFLYNHYMYVYKETSTCVPNTRFSNWPCPHWYAKKPDSHVDGSSTIGGDIIDMDDPAAGSYGSPIDGSVLIDRIPFAVVPGDIYNNPRDDKPDVGAMEVGLLQTPPLTNPPPLSPPSGFKPVYP